MHRTERRPEPADAAEAVKLLVTTAYRPSPELEAQARELASAWNARYILRRQSSVRRLRERYGELPLLVLTDRELLYYPEGEEPLFFHPSTALIRLKRLLKGESDLMLEQAGVRPGDRVLDCTAGLASDALVFAYAVGPTGRVTALESEPVLALLLRKGLAAYRTGLAPADEAMRRIEIVHVDHMSYLAGLPDNSCDVVYFDPMFRLPVGESSAMKTLRPVANNAALTEDTIREARRVAARTVVLKEHRDSPEFERLGFEKSVRSHSKIAYGVIKL